MAFVFFASECVGCGDLCGRASLKGRPLTAARVVRSRGCVKRRANATRRRGLPKGRHCNRALRSGWPHGSARRADAFAGVGTPHLCANARRTHGNMRARRERAEERTKKRACRNQERNRNRALALAEKKREGAERESKSAAQRAKTELAKQATTLDARTFSHPGGKRGEVSFGRARVKRVWVAVGGNGVQQRGAVQVALLHPRRVVDLVRQLGHPPGGRVWVHTYRESRVETRAPPGQRRGATECFKKASPPRSGVEITNNKKQ